MQSVMYHVHNFVTGESPSAQAPSFEPTPTPVEISPSGDISNKDNGSDVVHSKVLLLLEHLQNSISLSERQAAVSGLLQQLEQQPDGVYLGEEGIQIYMQTLITDPRDTELLNTMLDCLVAMIQSNRLNGHLIVSSSANMDILFSLIQDESTWIRGPSINVFQELQKIDCALLCSQILQSNQGLTRLIDLVNDSREHIRDQMIQILIQLVQESKDIQQFMAFEDVFSKLWQIMHLENCFPSESNDSAPAIGFECLHLIQSVLKDNPVTQTLFRQTQCIGELPMFLQLPAAKLASEDPETPPEKSYDAAIIARVKTALEIFNALVGDFTIPAEEDEMFQRDQQKRIHERQSIQSAVAKLPDLLANLLALICTPDDTTQLVEVQHMGITLLYHLVDSCEQNQLLVLNGMLPQPAISYMAALFRMEFRSPMADDLNMRKQIAQVLDCLLENEIIRMTIVQHIFNPPTPPLADTSEEDLHFSPGRILLEAMSASLQVVLAKSSNSRASFSEEDHEELKPHAQTIWQTCRRFSILLTDEYDAKRSSICRDLALRIPFDFTVENAASNLPPGGSFFTRLVRNLAQLLRVTTESNSSVNDAVRMVQVALFRVILCWLKDCPKAVEEFTSSMSNILACFDVINQQQPQNIEQHQQRLRRRNSSSFKSLQDNMEACGLAGAVLGSCLLYAGEDAKLAPRQFIELVNSRIGLEALSDCFIQMFQSSAFVNAAPLADPAVSPLLKEQQGVVRVFMASYPLIQSTFWYEKPLQLEFQDMNQKIQARVLHVYSMDIDGDANGASLSSLQAVIASQEKELQHLRSIQTTVAQGNSTGNTEEAMKLQLRLTALQEELQEAQNAAQTSAQEVVQLQNQLNNVSVGTSSNEEAQESERRKHEHALEQLKAEYEVQCQQLLQEKNDLKNALMHERQQKEALQTQLEHLQAQAMMPEATTAKAPTPSSEPGLSDNNLPVFTPEEIETLKVQHRDLLLLLANQVQ